MIKHTFYIWGFQLTVLSFMNYKRVWLRSNNSQEGWVRFSESLLRKILLIYLKFKKEKLKKIIVWTEQLFLQFVQLSSIGKTWWIIVALWEAISTFFIFLDNWIKAVIGLNLYWLGKSQPAFLGLLNIQIISLCFPGVQERLWGLQESLPQISAGEGSIDRVDQDTETSRGLGKSSLSRCFFAFMLEYFSGMTWY